MIPLIQKILQRTNNKGFILFTLGRNDEAIEVYDAAQIIGRGWAMESGNKSPYLYYKLE